MGLEVKDKEIRRAYSVDDIKNILGISRSMAYRLANSGSFRVVRIGHTLRVSKKSFDEWLDKQEDNTEDGVDDKNNIEESISNDSSSANLVNSGNKIFINDSKNESESKATPQTSDMVMLLKLMQNPETAQALRKLTASCSH